MREALWGLYDKGGYYFHDDFMVDGVKIKKEDLLFFSRDSMRWEKDRLRAYQDARKSGYAHFTLSALSIGLNPFLSRVIPKYVLSGAMLFLRQIKSQDFLLFQNLYWDFAFYALAYEKIFSHFSLISELGHNYFSSSHIAESIVCQNYGTEYYLMHWSDNSCNINRFINSFLGCDKYLLWGRAHFRGTEGNPEIMALTGLTFKKYIKQVATRRTQVLAEMNIEERGKIITFFDESFGGDCLMTELHYITFWETILRVAAQEKESTILIKPKDLSRYNHLPVGLKDRFLEIKKILEGTPNAYIIDAQRRSFIEAIGVSDIVVSQGMTSSSTIAIACGIEGFYLDEANYQHPFKDYFKDKIVFDNPDKLVKMIHETIYNKQSSLKNIPVCLLRKYDAFSDNFALERMRDILTGSRKKVGAIIQARMGSTRLPGKVMLKLGDKPILQHIVERLKLCQGIDEIVLAITVNSKDDILAELAVNNGIKFFRGDEEDVLARYFYAAKENKLDIIARVTSDCPFVDPYLVDDLAGCFAGYPAIDYISNTLKRTFPRGLDVEVFKFSALEKAFSSARLPYQREHVTPYIYEHRELFQLQNLENDCDLSGLRWTLDEKKDYEFIIEIYKRLYNKGRIFLTNDILMVLKEEPWLSDINSAVRQKAISK
jgi:spore coat polysaccharide biosynthesis protein SpsF